ncbi:hypothetical protein EJ02DRAFT_197620 [Clathrospora elynae]|uniref:Uncharacterized protein n=1 Tax=Clathrospora elynae TaxID=706981 RepID=A0A6A5T3S8_9PLEO|nr:hypothetical protein EJ02DRAFT_197620 [Clathrospora elynae]
MTGSAHVGNTQQLVRHEYIAKINGSKPVSASVTVLSKSRTHLGTGSLGRAQTRLFCSRVPVKLADISSLNPSFFLSVYGSMIHVGSCPHFPAIPVSVLIALGWFALGPWWHAEMHLETLDDTVGITSAHR